MAKARASAIALAIALVGAVAAPLHAQFGGLGGIVNKANQVKDAGDAMRAIGEEEEIRMGANLAGIVLGAAPLVKNPAQQRYVNRVGRWIARHSERPNLPWKFGIIDTDDINAFSTPGGYVLITRGLFDQLRSESELAGVLAHEIGHVNQKHHLRALQSRMGNTVFSNVGRSYIRGPGGIAGQMTDVLIEGGKNLFITGLDKGDEYEADRIGVVLAARSGYSPYGLVGVLQTLTAMPSDPTLAFMSKTHPQPDDRITRLGSAMGARLDGYAGLVEDLPGFARARGR